MIYQEMQRTVRELRELMRMREELDAEIAAAQDAIKAEMQAAAVYEYHGSDWRVTWNEVTSNRLDSAALKKAHPELVAEFTKTSTTRRFCVA